MSNQHNARTVRQTSKLRSLVLRHRPETIDLIVDANGWADIDDLIGKAHAHGTDIDRELLEHVVTTNPKRRFSISDDGRRIRANQGHSINVDVELDAAAPPARLFHGTAQRFLDSILDRGLERRNRLHVHLSDDPETAVAVGTRHGEPVVLTVDARAMAAAGHRFFRSANGVWLTDHVPAGFLSRDGDDLAAVINATRKTSTERPADG